MARYCTQCGKELANERRICKLCQKQNKREYAKLHYTKNKERGIKPIRYGITKCAICGKEIVKCHKNQLLCNNCYLASKRKCVEDYNQVERSNKANTIARQMVLDLGFKLSRHLHVHHIDENPSNNKLENFLILSDANHAKLHRYLDKNWSLLSKGESSKLENCWNILRVQLTTTWLETMSVKCLKITEIGQSAAEPLNETNIYRFV